MRVSLTERTAVSESTFDWAAYRPGARGTVARSAALWIDRRPDCADSLCRFAAHVPLPLPWLAVPIAAMLLSNLLLPHLITGFGGRRALGLTLILDVLALTALLALTGGPANPLTLLYLVQITLSAVVLSRAWTWSLGILSILGFGFLSNFIFHCSRWKAIFRPGLLGESIRDVDCICCGSVDDHVFRWRGVRGTAFHERQSLELQIKLTRHERLAAVGTLAAGAVRAEWGRLRQRSPSSPRGSRTLCAAELTIRAWLRMRRPSGPKSIDAPRFFAP